ncbi:MAG TPA: YdcF family protein, partial [Candidatus Deferrimicrobiaceae bacterium]|nr:YdcF family protein [Candidatus Deferrimicrobiaceae bacterium]
VQNPYPLGAPMMNERRSRLAGLLVFILFLSGCTAEQRRDPLVEAEKMDPDLSERARVYLMKGLVVERRLPRDEDGRPEGRSAFVYILGGGQESLSCRLKTAGRLYKEGTVNKILTLHRPGITEYDRALGRNFTNDEWVTAKLKVEGVPGRHVEFITIPRSAFDTFGEARVISELSRARRVDRLVLVTSSHHTERAWISFSHFNSSEGLELFIYGCDEKVGILELLRESLALRLYRYFVLPYHLIRANRATTGSPWTGTPDPLG